jgi:hypothetical protein
MKLVIFIICILGITLQATLLVGEGKNGILNDNHVCNYLMGLEKKKYPDSDIEIHVDGNFKNL